MLFHDATLHDINSDLVKGEFKASSLEITDNARDKHYSVSV